jgi:hypothetical protein
MQNMRRVVIGEANKISLNIATYRSSTALARTADDVSFFLTSKRYVALNEFLLGLNSHFTCLHRARSTSRRARLASYLLML